MEGLSAFCLADPSASLCSAVSSFSGLEGLRAELNDLFFARCFRTKSGSKDMATEGMTEDLLREIALEGVKNLQSSQPEEASEAVVRALAAVAAANERRARQSRLPLLTGLFDGAATGIWLTTHKQQDAENDREAYHVRLRSSSPSCQQAASSAREDRDGQPSRAAPNPDAAGLSMDPNGQRLGLVRSQHSPLQSIAFARILRVCWLLLGFCSLAWRSFPMASEPCLLVWRGWSPVLSTPPLS